MINRILTLIHLLLIAAVIYLGVSAFYRYVEVRLERPPEIRVAGAVQSETPETVIRPLAAYDPIVERDLFKTKERPKPEPEPKEEQMNVDALKQTDLKLKLWGTVSGNEQTAYAVIENTQKRKQDLFRVGDTIQNARVKMILRERVVLTVNGKDEVLDMEKRLASARPSARIRGSSAASPFPTTNAESSGEVGTVRLQREKIESAVNNVNNLMRQARIRPHFKDGKPDGLTLTRVRPNSIFTELGLRSGDIITGVDGQQIESVDDALRFYRSLKSSSNVKLEIRRRGQKQQLEYQIE